MGALSAGFDTVSPGLAFSKDQELMSTQPLLLQSRMLSFKPIVTFEISNVCENPKSILHLH